MAEHALDKREVDRFKSEPGPPITVWAMAASLSSFVGSATPEEGGMANPGSAATRPANVDAFAARVRPTISILRSHGLTLRQTADKLTTMGIKTPKGCVIWTATGVRRILARTSPRSITS